MEVELRVYEVEPGLRWSFAEMLHEELLPLHDRLGLGASGGTFYSYRDDRTFVSLHVFRDAVERLKAREQLWESAATRALLQNGRVPISKLTVRNLAPAAGSAMLDLDAVRALAESNVLEIRQYRIASGQRERFADFFAQRTLAAQEACGMRVHGQFNELDDESSFVWFRGFPDLIERERRKEAFYQSRLWFDELETEAFSMIEDYSNVILAMPSKARPQRLTASL
jgi:hypothetical protein